jgi:hypothetical protein
MLADRLIVRDPSTNSVGHRSRSNRQNPHTGHDRSHLIVATVVDSIR